MPKVIADHTGREKTFCKARFLFAPIWVADWESDCPDVLARWGFLGEIIFDLAQFFAQSINLFLSFSNPDYEPHFQILVLEDENGRPL